MRRVTNSSHEGARHRHRSKSRKCEREPHRGKGCCVVVTPEGPEGPAGQQGNQGPQGTIGPQGIAGSAGPQGQVGHEGPQGSVGPQGSTSTSAGAMIPFNWPEVNPGFAIATPMGPLPAADGAALGVAFGLRNHRPPTPLPHPRRRSYQVPWSGAPSARGHPIPSLHHLH